MSRIVHQPHLRRSDNLLLELRIDSRYIIPSSTAMQLKILIANLTDQFHLQLAKAKVTAQQLEQMNEELKQDNLR